MDDHDQAQGAQTSLKSQRQISTASYSSHLQFKTEAQEITILLERGRRIEARAWGNFDKPRYGECVFSTAMSGIEESLSDPSYFGQILVSTIPHVGNTGVNFEDKESARVWASGLICRKCTSNPSSWRAKTSLAQWMVDDNAFIVEGVDTRELTIELRENGAQRAVLFKKDSMSTEEAMSFIEQNVPSMKNRCLIHDVSTKEVTPFREDEQNYWPFQKIVGKSFSGKKVGVWDFGVKTNTLRILKSFGVDVWVFPSNSQAEDILSHQLDGMLLSNGPGDPSAAPAVVSELKKIIGKLPIMGICMGNQLLSLALGAKTEKMKFGHRGIHHPVNEYCPEGKVLRTWITSQNHGFVVDESSLPDNVRVLFRHADDGSVEGIESEELRLFSAQFHPEAAPGTLDCYPLFERFLERL